MEPCRACGLPAAHALCDDCTPCGALLSEHPDERLAALMAASDLPTVRRAVLRGGRLWRDHAGAAIGWLASRGDTTFLRWIAEDSRHGAEAIEWLAEHDGSRSVTRLPVWIGVHGDTAQKAWFAGTFRGGTPAPRSDWGPDAAALERARVVRRWPLPPLEEDGLICCTLCGEAAMDEGPCWWCGQAGEPPSALPIGDLLAERERCPSCRIDVTSRLEPIVCPGCGEERIPA